jgi:tetratricopeptide (TPR) repeat protein
VSDALKALRVERDPTRALALLDGHAARHPVGALGREADVLRLEALVALGRTPAALALLERMALPARAGGELLVLRGELRAQAGRMREARADFEAALEAGLDEPALVERALYGRASAVSRLGEAGAARTALEAYLARFPRGRHAADVRRALEAR